ncbi:unnamed protein product [Cyclocybe aegerita]|uniref:Uncharacterized protein n=1 Tax=Cyclocybe aegerita TaxID=1973307 RepID=A0A8S0WCN3_CYCAE|nr:unnamed protein product [Cyclocybe aegerita]
MALLKEVEALAEADSRRLQPGNVVPEYPNRVAGYGASRRCIDFAPRYPLSCELTEVSRRYDANADRQLQADVFVRILNVEMKDPGKNLHWETVYKPVVILISLDIQLVSLGVELLDERYGHVSNFGVELVQLDASWAWGTMGGEALGTRHVDFLDLPCDGADTTN